MRRPLLASILFVSGLIAAIGLVGPSAAQEQPTDTEGKGQETALLHIVKVVDGDGPTGGFQIDYTCFSEDDRDASEGGGIDTGGSLAFDDAGPGAPETQTITLFGPGTCIVEETDSNGAASVTYDCSFVSGQAPPSPDGSFAEGNGQGGGCIDDQSGIIWAPDDELTITVTNTFDPEVLPDDDEPPAVNPDVVAATPSFTG